MFNSFHGNKADTDLIGKSSDSASPTDTFTVITKETQYALIDHSEKVSFNTIFYKVFIDPESIKNAVKYAERSSRTKEEYKPYINLQGISYLKGGVYEYEVYKNIIRPILDNKVSPHFLRYYTINTGVSYKEYLNKLTNIYKDMGISS